jgi:hypothetical protein
MRPFAMTMIALTAFAGAVVTAQAEKQTARPSQTVSAAATCTGLKSGCLSSFGSKGVEVKAEAREALDAKAGEVPVRPAHEPSKVLEYYVSYAWGDDTPEGKEREAVVDRLCSEAEARGKRIIRDKTAMNFGDRISTFMDRIGKGAVNGRVCIVLSDKYLKSPYCMHELFDVWRNCREEDSAFIERTRAYVLPSAQIGTLTERTQYVLYWRAKFEEMDALAKTHGPGILAAADLADYRSVQTFVSKIPTC